MERPKKARKDRTYLGERIPTKVTPEAQERIKKATRLLKGVLRRNHVAYVEPGELLPVTLKNTVHLIVRTEWWLMPVRFIILPDEGTYNEEGAMKGASRSLQKNRDKFIEAGILKPHRAVIPMPIIFAKSGHGTEGLSDLLERILENSESSRAERSKVLLLFNMA